MLKRFLMLSILVVLAISPAVASAEEGTISWWATDLHVERSWDGTVYDGASYLVVEGLLTNTGDDAASILEAVEAELVFRDAERYEAFAEFACDEIPAHSELSGSLVALVPDTVITAEAGEAVMTVTVEGVVQSTFLSPFMDAEAGFEEQSARNDVGSVTTMGSYEGEAVEWIVIAQDGNRRLLLSKYGLDARAYHDRKRDVDWENCALRKWLNSDFLRKVFTDEERALIVEEVIDNQDNEAFGTNGGSTTTDQIFLLSAEEAERYLPEAKDRALQPTPLALKHRAWANENGISMWWLRSPGRNPQRAQMVIADGQILTDGNYVDYKNVCVRPAFWMLQGQ